MVNPSVEQATPPSLKCRILCKHNIWHEHNIPWYLLWACKDMNVSWNHTCAWRYVCLVQKCRLSPKWNIHWSGATLNQVMVEGITLIISLQCDILLGKHWSWNSWHWSHQLHTIQTVQELPEVGTYCSMSHQIEYGWYSGWTESPFITAHVKLFLNSSSVAWWGTLSCWRSTATGECCFHEFTLHNVLVVFMGQSTVEINVIHFIRQWYSTAVQQIIINRFNIIISCLSKLYYTFCYYIFWQYSTTMFYCCNTSASFQQNQ